MLELFFPKFESESIGKISRKEFDIRLSTGWRHFGNEFFCYNYNFYQDNFVMVLPLRIDLTKFVFSKSQQKVLRKNEDAEILIRPFLMNEEKVNLFESHKQKFESDPPDSLFTIIPENPEQNPCDTFEVSIFKNEKLLATSIMDVGEISVSSVYAFYDLNEKARSLGILTMLLEIKYALENNFQYYYHGYAYNVSSYYDYKKKFSAVEYYDWNGKWNSLEPID